MPHLRKTVASGLIMAFRRVAESLTPNEVEGLARHIFSDNTVRSSSRMELFIRTAERLFSAVPNDFRVNGEMWLLKQTAALGLTTIFDVGANIGDWSSCASEFHPSATVHAFEIVPDTFGIMANNLTCLPNVVLNAFGLSDQDGEVAVHLGSSPLVSSVFQFDHETTTRTLNCKVARGDTYAAGMRIMKLDLLKIDVEGAEGAVIKGFDQMISRAAVRIIQFEYNMGAIESHFLLLDFYRYLTQKRYVLGRLTPQGVLFRDYRYAFEDFNGPNYVACLADDRELIDLISVPTSG